MKEMFDAMITDAWTNLIEREDIYKLAPQSVIDLYALEYLRSKDLGDDADIFDAVQGIKNNVLLGYKPVIQNQIAKYVEKGRYKGEAPNPEETTYAKLLDGMKRTLRGDMARPNIQWETLIQHLIDLRDTDDMAKMLYILDRIFNLTHNTKTKILDKFPNKQELFDAFEFCSKAQSIEDYKGKVSRRVGHMLSGIKESVMIEGIKEEYAPGYSEYEKEMPKGQFLQPAFLDKDTGKIYPTKGFHNIEELPDYVKNFEEGFMTLQGKFLTRQEAAVYTGSVKKELAHA